MKKNIILGIIIALLVVAVAVEGFLLWKQNNDKNKEEGTEKVQETVNTPEPSPTTNPKELPKNETIDGENLKISKKYSNPKEDELVYTYLTVTVEDKLNYNQEYDEDYWKYTYEIPQINLESKEIEKINKEIVNKYEDIIDEMNERQGIDFSCESLSYEYSENDEILSLVLINKTESSQVTVCQVYNIDTSTGKEISNNELIEKIGIDEKEVKARIIKAIDNSRIYEEQESIDKDFIKQQEEKTKNKYKNISIDKIALYVKSEKFTNGEIVLCACLEIYALAGGETEVIYVDLIPTELE